MPPVRAPWTYIRYLFFFLFPSRSAFSSSCLPTTRPSVRPACDRSSPDHVSCGTRVRGGARVVTTHRPDEASIRIINDVQRVTLYSAPGIAAVLLVSPRLITIPTTSQYLPREKNKTPYNLYNVVLLRIRTSYSARTYMYTRHVVSRTMRGFDTDAADVFKTLSLIIRDDLHNAES